MTRTMAARRVGQVLLLVVLTLGVLGMHTLGHPSAEHGAASSSVMAVSHEVASGLSAAPSHRPMTDPMKVCLAILTAMGFAGVLIALLSIARRCSATGAVCCGVRTICGRGPPSPVPPLRRRLATLSVLRT
jgi:hypothetical protein